MGQGQRTCFYPSQAYPDVAGTSDVATHSSYERDECISNTRCLGTAERVRTGPVATPPC